MAAAPRRLTSRGIRSTAIVALALTGFFGPGLTGAAPTSTLFPSAPSRPADVPASSAAAGAWNMIAIANRNGANCNYPKIVATADFTGSSSPTWVDITGAGITNSGCHIQPVLRVDPFDPANSAYLLTSDGLFHTANLRSTPPTWTNLLSLADMRTGTKQSDAYFLEGMTLSALDQGYVAVLVKGNSGGGLDNRPVYFGRTHSALGGPSTWTWSQVAPRYYMAPSLWVSQETTQRVYVIDEDSYGDYTLSLRVSNEGGDPDTWTTYHVGVVNHAMNSQPASLLIQPGTNDQTIFVGWGNDTWNLQVLLKSTNGPGGPWINVTPSESSLYYYPKTHESLQWIGGKLYLAGWYLTCAGCNVYKSAVFSYDGSDWTTEKVSCNDPWWVCQAQFAGHGFSGWPNQPAWMQMHNAGFGAGHVGFSQDGGATWVDKTGNLLQVVSDTVSVRYLTPGPYDCTVAEASLSPIGQAVLAVVGEQNYCFNNYEGLTAIPTGDPLSGKVAFAQMADMVAGAKFEVDFVTMGWDEERVPLDDNRGELDAGDDSPGVTILRGLRTLYQDVLNNPTNYPEGVRARILLGLQHYGATERHDQRVYVLEALERLEIDYQGQTPNWQTEVAAFRDSLSIPSVPLQGMHSHAKMLIVDGQTVVVSGYNLHYNYLHTQDSLSGGVDVPVRDMDIRVSGPIAQDALAAFDRLWAKARGCSELTYDPFAHRNICATQFTTEAQGEIPHAPQVLGLYLPGGTPVAAFSLFRDHDDKTADEAILAAIRAATSEVNIVQNRFFENNPELYPLTIPLPFPNFFDDNGPMPYTEAIVEAVSQNDVQVNLLLSCGIADCYINQVSAYNLWRMVYDADPSALANLKVKFFKDGEAKLPDLHTKALAIDGQFVIAGGQNFDFSAFGASTGFLPGDFDLAEYSLGVDSVTAAADFDNSFGDQLANAYPLTIVDAAHSLQAAVAQASPGAVVFVSGGVYTESVIIDKPLTLVGLAPGQTLIQAASAGTPALRVTSSDVVISHLSLRSSGAPALALIDSSAASLENIRVSNVVFESAASSGVLVEGLISSSPIEYSLENNTFVGGTAGVTINVLESQAVASRIRNNIFAGQSVAPIEILSADDGNVEYSYNLFYDCGASGDCTTGWRSGSLNPASSEHDNLFNLNPLFVSAGTGDYRLAWASPAIDAGDPSVVNDLVFDGNADGVVRIDIGAIESLPGLTWYLPLVLHEAGGEGLQQSGPSESLVLPPSEEPAEGYPGPGE